MKTIRSCTLTGIVSALFVLATTQNAAADTSTSKVRITLPQGASAQANLGAGAVRDALEKAGLQVVAGTSTSSPDIEVMVSEKAGSDPNTRGGKTLASDKPESYAVSVSANHHAIYVNGSDATGAMYGEFDLAEQIATIHATDFVSQIKPVTKSPFLEIRGVNMFLTVQDIDTPQGAFWSDDYWKIYLDMMARNRYNFLDIHGPCDAVTLTFPNGFGYFVSLPDFPEVGVGAEKAAKNMARFRRVIQMAADRGIKVGYMNYETAPTIGAWKTRQFGVDDRWAKETQKYLTGPRLETYTREAVVSLLKQLPDLWMFGFRIGESGQPEDFYKRTYLAAIAEFPPTLKIYLRTWIADPEKVRELAATIKNPVYIEPKYNGEQLGLPYQAALGGRHYPPSGSYENYTDKPRNYSIIWQIRAHGTTRVFSWADAEFARRTVRTCKFGDGLGFSMEQMEAYMPAADYLHNNPKTDHHFYKWMVEREWAWNLIWGRVAYDPDVPDQVFENEFINRFGAQAGPLVLKALTASSKIVPFIYSYHNVGLDHQDFAPEFETGDHAFGARSRMWQGSRLVPYGGNSDDFLRVNTLDRTAMASPSVYVEDRLNGVVSGKMTPFEAASYLDAAAAKSKEMVAEAAKLNPSSPENFDCIRLDIEAAAWLARYYGNRIRSATHLSFYESTMDHPQLTEAYADLKLAATDWDRLSDVTEQHFGPMPEYIRMGVKDFLWRDEGRALGGDLDQLNDLESAFRRLTAQAGRYGVVIGHVPPAKAEPGKPLKLSATFATAEDEPHVYLFYRNSQSSGYSRLELSRDNDFERTWSVVLPGVQVTAGSLDYYFGADSGRCCSYAETIAHRPPFHILVNDNGTRPKFSATPHALAAGDAVNLSVHVDAKTTIKSVSVYYKRMPAYYEWLQVEMHPTGDGNYAASVPLTPEGILYYFTAADEDGNAANCPDFLERTPYFAVDSWDSQGAAK